MRYEIKKKTAVIFLIKLILVPTYMYTECF